MTTTTAIATDHQSVERQFAEIRFRAMGTDAHVIVVGHTGRAPSLLPQAARARIDQIERLWSRFDPDSEVSSLNRKAGEWVAVGPETLRLVSTSERAQRATDGRFDPLVGRAVEALGYDRSFELVGRVRDFQHPRLVAAERPEIDAAAFAARLPESTSFDPGGIGKGLAADIVVSELIDAGAAGAMVNLGGDLVVGGIPPDGDFWSVCLDMESTKRVSPCVIGLERGAVATSTTLKRRWFNGEAEVHHIVDPDTGLNPCGPVAQATVVAGAGWWAEAAATSLVGGDMLIDPPEATAVRLIDGSGNERSFGDFAEYEIDPVGLRAGWHR